MTSEAVPNPIQTFSVDPQPITLGPPGASSYLSATAILTPPSSGATPQTVILTVKYIKNGSTQTALSSVPMSVTGGPTSYNARFGLSPFGVVQGAAYFGEIVCTWAAKISERATTSPTIT